MDFLIKPRAELVLALDNAAAIARHSERRRRGGRRLTRSAVIRGADERLRWG